MIEPRVKRTLRSRPAVALAAGLVLALFAPAAGGQVLSCPLGGGGDQVTRGFYVTNYVGSTLGTVHLTYYTNGTAGAYTISLTARSTTYAGALIGTKQVIISPSDSSGTEAVFDFGGTPVVPGSTVTFAQSVVDAPAGGVLFYDTGTCGLGAPCGTCPNVFETEDTTPPLSTLRRDSIGLTIGGSAAPAATVPALSGVGLFLLAAALASAALLVLRGR